MTKITQNVTQLQVLEQKRTKQAKQIFLYSYKENAKLQVAKACREAGISRMTYYRWLKNDPEFKRGCELARTMFHDEVKDRLMMQVLNGSVRATIAYLKLYHPDYGGRPIRF